MTGKLSKAGRNLTGSITVRGRGAGIKKNIIFVDYLRKWSNKIGICLHLIKTPQHTNLPALIKYSNGTFSYILSSETFSPGCKTYSTSHPIILLYKYKDDCCNILIKYIDYTLLFFNIEIFKKSGAKYARAAGTFCKVVAFNLALEKVKIELPSKKYKIISPYCMVTLGRSSNVLHNKEFFTTAGYSRKINFRPKVRGVATNPVDHPHGGRTKSNSPELTPWGKIAKKNK